MPTTRTVSIRAFRANLTKYLKEAQENNVHFVVMRHAEPIAHVTPLATTQSSYDRLVEQVAQARKDFAEGRYYTSEEVLAMIDRRANHLFTSGREKSRKSAAKNRTKNHSKNGVVRSARKSSVIRKKTH